MWMDTVKIHFYMTPRLDCQLKHRHTSNGMNPTKVSMEETSEEVFIGMLYKINLIVSVIYTL